MGSSWRISLLPADESWSLCSDCLWLCLTEEEHGVQASSPFPQEAVWLARLSDVCCTLWGCQSAWGCRNSGIHTKRKPLSQAVVALMQSAKGKGGKHGVYPFLERQNSSIPKGSNNLHPLNTHVSFSCRKLIESMNIYLVPLLDFKHTCQEN